jgi:hypothetical protein
MKIKINNLGVLRNAEFEIADLTLICGDNNGGKTYATYALLGFLLNWRDLLSVEIPESTIDALVKNGVVRLDIDSYAGQLHNMLSQGQHPFVQRLPRRVFTSKSDRFAETSFQVELDRQFLSAAKTREFQLRIGSGESAFLTLTKNAEDDAMVATSIVKRSDTSSSGAIRALISYALISFLLDDIFPRPFVASAERTGVAMFRGTLVTMRRMYNPLDSSASDFDLFAEERLDYPLPVEVNIDFLRRIEKSSKDDSFLALEHRDVLSEFSDIIGGEYVVSDNDTIYFRPVHQDTTLTMDESSSAVRSLLVIGLYLRHVARKGDLLIVDEPELNLHPRNQRRLARLFVRLVNLGIRVFATTHSDFLVKELNTLMMLNQEKPHLQRISRKIGYRTEELLNPEQVKVYLTKPVESESTGDSGRSHTLVEASINEEYGIEARSFDDTINEMNEIQDAILWGDDE